MFAGVSSLFLRQFIYDLLLLLLDAQVKVDVRILLMVSRIDQSTALLGPG